MIKLWNWMSGELLADIAISGVVEPFIKVRPPAGRHEQDGGDHESEQIVKVGRRQGRKARGKGKGKADDVADQEEETIVVAESELQDAPTETPAATESAEQEATLPSDNGLSAAESDRLVVALQRIDSVNIDGQGQFFVFSAIGCVARLHGSYVLSLCASAGRRRCFPARSRPRPIRVQHARLPRSTWANQLSISLYHRTIIFGSPLTASV